MERVAVALEQPADDVRRRGARTRARAPRSTGPGSPPRTAAPPRRCRTCSRGSRTPAARAARRPRRPPPRAAPGRPRGSAPSRRASARSGPRRPASPAESNSLTFGMTRVRFYYDVVCPYSYLESHVVEAAEDAARSRSSGCRSSCGRRRSRCSRCAATTCGSTGRRTSTRGRWRWASRSTCRATSRARRCRCARASGRASRAAARVQACALRGVLLRGRGHRDRRARSPARPSAPASTRRRDRGRLVPSAVARARRSAPRPRPPASAASRRCSPRRRRATGAWAASSACSPASRSSRAADAHVEIIFFSTPTPAATARSYSSGTVAESWSAIPVESKTVTCVVGLPALELAADHLADLAGDVVLRDQPLARAATLISPSSRHWRMSSTKTRAALEDARVELLLALQVGAERGDVRARLHPGVVDEPLPRVRAGDDHVGARRPPARRRSCR